MPRRGGGAIVRTRGRRALARGRSPSASQAGTGGIGRGPSARPCDARQHGVGIRSRAHVVRGPAHPARSRRRCPLRGQSLAEQQGRRSRRGDRRELVNGLLLLRTPAARDDPRTPVGSLGRAPDEPRSARRRVALQPDAHIRPRVQRRTSVQSRALAVAPLRRTRRAAARQSSRTGTFLSVVMEVPRRSVRRSVRREFVFHTARVARSRHPP